MAVGQKPKASATVAGSDAAPIIFLDAAYAYGSNGSIVQIEVGTFTLIPIQGTDKVATRAICTGHLRMSPDAARSLRDLLTKALDRFEKPAPGERKN